MATDLDLLRDLCAAPAPTGFEAPVQDLVRRRLSALSEPQGDPLGNVWATVAGKGAPGVVVTAHADQIGLIVTLRGRARLRLRSTRSAASTPQLLPGRNLSSTAARAGERRRRPQALAHDDQGRARQGAGPHDQWLDLGCSTREEALALVADRRPHHVPADFLELAGGRYASPALRQPRRRLRVLRALELYAEAPAAADLTGCSPCTRRRRSWAPRRMAIRWQPGRDHRRRRRLRQRRPRPGRQEARRRGQARRRPRDPPRRRRQPRAHRPRASRSPKDEGIPVQIKAHARQHLDRRRRADGRRHAATLPFSLPVRNMHSAFEVAQPDDAEAGARWPPR